MKALIVGASGQVGRALQSRAPHGVEVIAATREHLDISAPESLSRTIGIHAPEVIINAAAYTAVDRAESEADLAARVNRDGPKHLARAARECGARFVHISTDFVFDGQASRPYSPDASTAPLSVYGRTKREGEIATLEEYPEAVIVRTAWVYSAGGANFLQTMLRLMRAHGKVRVVADQVGTPTSAPALADVLWRLAATPAIRGIHHWTDSGVASWYDFAVAIAEEGRARGLLANDVTVLPITTADYPTPAKRPAYSVLDTRSLAALEMPTVHWRQRLREILAEAE